MTMAVLQFYMNEYHYPHYKETLTTYGLPMDCTPVGMGLKSGQLRVKGTMTDFMHCNYLHLDRGGELLYAWIEDVTYLTADSFTVSYSVDAWRTYKTQIDLGVQYIARAPQGTLDHMPKQDRLLGGMDPYNIIESKKFSIGDPTKRVFVVQMRTDSGEIFSRSPVNPTPYQFYMTEYDVNNWTANPSLDSLLTAISGAQPENVVTMYSIPYMDLVGLTAQDLVIHTATDNITVTGFKILGGTDSPTLRLSNTTPITFDFNLRELFDGPHSVQLVVPEAGILNIPDELLAKPDLVLRQDVDLFSGASNYMLATGGTHYTNSIRGSSISSIPIVSDPMDTYLSQNQNALATSLMGDVAMIAGGAAMAFGLPGIGAAIGGGGAMTGVSNIVQREVAKSEAGNNFSNPPAFLGTALASSFNQTFWVVTSRPGIDNRQLVHDHFGWVYEMIDTLTFPTSGFIQTEGCAVHSKPGWAVPKWALEEVNSIFNAGILVH